MSMLCRLGTWKICKSGQSAWISKGLASFPWLKKSLLHPVSFRRCRWASSEFLVEGRKAYPRMVRLCAMNMYELSLSYLISCLLACHHEDAVADIIVRHIGQCLPGLGRSNGTFDPPRHAVHCPREVLHVHGSETIGDICTLWDDGETSFSISLSQVISQACEKSLSSWLHGIW